MTYDITILFSNEDSLEKTGVDEKEMYEIKAKFMYSSDSFIDFEDNEWIKYLINPAEVCTVYFEEIEEETGEKKTDNSGVWLFVFWCLLCIASMFVLHYRDNISDFFISNFNW